jgi:hypothetical protein
MDTTDPHRNRFAFIFKIAESSPFDEKTKLPRNNYRTLKKSFTITS